MKISAPPIVRTQGFPPRAHIGELRPIGDERPILEEIKVEREAFDMQAVRNARAVIGVPLRLLRGAPGLAQGDGVAHGGRLLDEFRCGLGKFLLKGAHIIPLVMRAINDRSAKLD